MQSVTKISLVGRQEIAREGLHKILSSEGFHMGESVADVDTLLIRLKSNGSEPAPHVIIVDDSHDSDGLDACRKLASIKANARLLLLADHYAFQTVVDAFQIGVDGVIVKEISCERMVESIRLVALGEKVFPSQLANNLASFMPSEDVGDWKASATAVGLSDREVEILEAVTAGMANKVIARKFGICEATVKVHVKAILRKLHVDNRTQSATWAVKHGIG